MKELDEEMEYPEFVTWIALDEIRAHELDQASKRAKQGMKSTPRRR